MMWHGFDIVTITPEIQDAMMRMERMRVRNPSARSKKLAARAKRKRMRKHRKR